MAETDLSTVAGIWDLPNPDKGEELFGDDARLMVGGRYEIGLDGAVTAQVQFRDRHGRLYDDWWTGAARVVEDNRVTIEYDDGHTESFVRADIGTLRRDETTRPTAERDCRLKRTESYRRKIPSGGEKPIPPILFNTMPKSGSIFIENWLAHSLGLNQMKVAVCLFPDDLVIRDKLEELAKGNAIAQQHLPAKDINLRFIAARLGSLVVHVRDPRQATLSWTHHLDNFHAHRDDVPACALGLEAVSPPLPDDYFSWEFERKLAYQVDHHLPLLVDWVTGWLEASEHKACGLNILLTTYEDFVASPRRFVEKILDHFSIPHDKFLWDLMPGKDPENHYRVGKTDEWRDVFSDADKAKATSMITPNLCKTFGWSIE